MSRARAISRSEVERRPQETAIDRELIEKLVELAVASQEKKQKLDQKLITTIKAYRARMLADQQERAARIVAALKRGLDPARKLLAWLNSLPVGVLIELQAGDLQSSLGALIPKIKDRLAYWQRHVGPTGNGPASLALPLSLKDIYEQHSVSLRFKSGRERQRQLNKLVARACREIGAKYPNEKEHPQLFAGKQKLPSKPGPKLYRRPLFKSKAERRLERGLKDIPI
jgi:hypothetical protein